MALKYYEIIQALTNRTETCSYPAYRHLPIKLNELLELIKKKGYVVHITNDGSHLKLLSKKECNNEGLQFEHLII